MTKLELMTVLVSLEKLHEAGKPDMALALIKELLEEVRME